MPRHARWAIWVTDHSIALNVGRAVAMRLMDAGWRISLHHVRDVSDESILGADYHIGYGILRGTAQVFKQASLLEKPWFNIDRGYFGADHFAGFYRFSLYGTQNHHRFMRDRSPPLAITLSDLSARTEALICPPTDDVADFYSIDTIAWHAEAEAEACRRGLTPLWRPKGTARDLADDLARVALVITFNSAVGLQALQLGIPVLSHKKFSALGDVSLPEHVVGAGATAGFVLAKLHGAQFRLADVGAADFADHCEHLLAQEEKIRPHLPPGM
ncbi:MAG: hypothetical protein EBZ69_05705 [Alphaproteobacteria bacterium]|nr:hypothetical protein [Alphaproteobacteria bacterium]NDC56287.1 hypothetical protein [Alphaproteobacteria bacterium]NDG04415.1 hypothetical protein [Alphaproteobacteria bacterium]